MGYFEEGGTDRKDRQKAGQTPQQGTQQRKCFLATCVSHREHGRVKPEETHGHNMGRDGKRVPPDARAPHAGKHREENGLDEASGCLASRGRERGR